MASRKINRVLDDADWTGEDPARSQEVAKWMEAEGRPYIDDLVRRIMDQLPGRSRLLIPAVNI
jgi:hypothetical protein